MADTSVARDQLRSIVERIERLEEEKKATADDIKEVYGEAKANGFDTKTLRTVVRLRKVEATERAEQEMMLDLYLSALGMLPDVGVDEPGAGASPTPDGDGE
ncbi:MAG: DUF2312 domain-containing protein [Rhizobiaceae bacterium]